MLVLGCSFCDEQDVITSSWYCRGSTCLKGFVLMYEIAENKFVSATFKSQ